MQMPFIPNICGSHSRGVRVGDALKRFGSLLLKAVITLPRMVLYFIQPITFNESLYRDIARDRKKK